LDEESWMMILNQARIQYKVMVERLIVVLTSSLQYCSYVHDENVFINNKPCM